MCKMMVVVACVSYKFFHTIDATISNDSLIYNNVQSYNVVQSSMYDIVIIINLSIDVMWLRIVYMMNDSDAKLDRFERTCTFRCVSISYVSRSYVSYSIVRCHWCSE